MVLFKLQKIIIIITEIDKKEISIERRVDPVDRNLFKIVSYRQP